MIDQNVASYAADSTGKALKTEIDDIEAVLFYNLDSLANFAYTPKPFQKEGKIITKNVPAIMMED